MRLKLNNTVFYVYFIQNYSKIEVDFIVLEIFMSNIAVLEKYYKIDTSSKNEKLYYYIFYQCHFKRPKIFSLLSISTMSIAHAHCTTLFPSYKGLKRDKFIVQSPFQITPLLKLPFLQCLDSSLVTNPFPYLQPSIFSILPNIICKRG